MYFDHFAVSLVVFVSCALATTCDFNGGFGIRVPGNCSGDVFDCSAKTSLANRCCPKGTYCVYENDNGFCCPTENGCAADVVNVPKVSSHSSRAENRRCSLRRRKFDETILTIYAVPVTRIQALGISRVRHQRRLVLRRHILWRSWIQRQRLRCRRLLSRRPLATYYDFWRVSAIFCDEGIKSYLLLHD